MTAPKQMTPEERAARFSWQQCPGGEGHDAGDEGFAYTCAKCHSDLIRAAEKAANDEALERAIHEVAHNPDGADDVFTLSRVCSRLRALKSNGGGR